MEYPSYYKAIKRKYRFTGKSNQKLSEAKDKAWAILSDYTRMRDFARYGRCISCGARFENWRDAQGGHFISMGGHGTKIGFDERNVHAQCQYDNQMGGMDAGAEYGRELERRYGDIEKELRVLQHETVKADEFYFVKRIEAIHELFVLLKEEYPDLDYPEYMCG